MNCRTMPTSAMTTKATIRLNSQEPVACRDLVADIAAEQIERAVRQVDVAHQPEDQREAARHQEIEAAERDAVEQRVEEDALAAEHLLELGRPQREDQKQQDASRDQDDERTRPDGVPMKLLMPATPEARQAGITLYRLPPDRSRTVWCGLVIATARAIAGALSRWAHKPSKAATPHRVGDGVWAHRRVSRPGAAPDGCEPRRQPLRSDPAAASCSVSPARKRIHVSTSPCTPDWCGSAGRAWRTRLRRSRASAVHVRERPSPSC